MTPALVPILVAMALIPGVALGEGLVSRAWVDGCSDDGAVPECRLIWPGGRLAIADDGATPVELLDLMRMQETGAAVQVMGELTSPPGPVTEIVLGAVEILADDPTASLIAALQGDWQERDGTGRGFSLRGGDWRWAGADASGEALIAGFGGNCPEVPAGQTALALLSDDPGQPGLCLGVTLDGDAVRLDGAGGGVFDRAAGQAFDGNAYFLGCDAEGVPVFCYFQSGPLALSVSQDDTDPGLWATVEGFSTLEPVTLSGVLSDQYGTSASLIPGQIARRPDDPFVARLLAMQGNWQAAGYPAAGVEISGLDWLETDPQGHLVGFAMEPGTSCATTGQGAGLSLTLRAFDDPDAAPRCLDVTALTTDQITLRDPTATTGATTGDFTLTKLPEGVELP